jgi:hypothetical protein
MWQVHANGRTFDTDLIEMTQWIGEGALLREDKVRKGNLRWIEAGKVPALIAVFNAKDNGEPLPAPVVTMTSQEARPDAAAMANPLNPAPASYRAPSYATPPSGFEEPAAGNYQTTPTPEEEPASTGAPVCSVHPDVDAMFKCDTCYSLFCRTCPKSYGGTVKICPMCGAMCSSIGAQQTKTAAPAAAYFPTEGFGFGDFTKALAYPFKFTTSLIIGAIMYMLFSVGQSISGFGGMFMMGSAIMCFMLANTLTFGVLSNTVENFAHGKIGKNFMPSFDDFSIWDDVVHPFFLSVGVYIASFGPLIAVFILAFFMISNTVSSGDHEMNTIQSETTQAVAPELPYADRVARQSAEVHGLLNKQQDAQKRRAEMLANAVEKDEEALGTAVPADPDEEEFNKLNQLIQDQRKAQLEGVVGKTPETKAKEQSEFLKQIIAYGIFFLIVGGLCLAWALFYFPAACAVAGYTGSFAATINPAVGLDTIRCLGVDYAKILLMGLAIILMSGFLTSIIEGVLSPFDMPGLGNVPAKALGSLFGFYFSVVFSCVLGFALYKGASKLQLPT